MISAYRYKPQPLCDLEEIRFAVRAAPCFWHDRITFIVRQNAVQY